MELRFPSTSDAEAESVAAVPDTVCWGTMRLSGTGGDAAFKIAPGSKNEAPSKVIDFSILVNCMVDSG